MARRTAGSPRREVDAILTVSLDGVGARFAVGTKDRTPFPNELDRLKRAQEVAARHGVPLLVVPFVSESLGSRLTNAGWSWADGEGNFDLRGPGIVLRQRRTDTPPRRRTAGLPLGSGSLGIVRVLIGFGQDEDEEAGASALAAQASVSQPRASQVLHRLKDLGLVERTPNGRWRAHREPLLDRFLAEYPGPQGSESYFYSLEPPTDVAVAASASRARTGRLAVSADVGPDLLRAWRRPTTVILYSDEELVGRLPIVPAHGPDDANVVVRSPKDRSVFPNPRLVYEFQGTELELADPTQQIWDLQQLGGADRLEAAGELREWLLTRP